MRVLALRSETASEAAARADLRAQIARLEAAGGRAPGGTGPRLLSLGELEAVRDALLSRRTSVMPPQEGAWRTFEAMVADPRAHKWQRIALAELGLPGCGAYRVVPRFGPIGAFAGWWQITLSSGCP